VRIRRLILLLVAVALVAGIAPVTHAAAAAPTLPPPQVAPLAADGCAAGKPQAFFLAIVYDPEQRNDFVLDVDHFEKFLGTLKQTWCIPAANATILAFENGFTRNGKTYATGSEANLKAEIARMGAAAQTAPGSKFFFFLSSHGNLWPSPVGTVCKTGRIAGSYSAIAAGGTDDGFLDDCELGESLNANVKSVPSFIAVDCSFCGGFSDSPTAVSGTVPDGAPVGAGVVAPSRIVVTGCAITTECFGSTEGANSYRLFDFVLGKGAAYCDGWTAPAFPAVQGLDAPVHTGALDGKCSASELFFAALEEAYALNAKYVDEMALTIQQQFRIKYGFPTLASDIRFL
jgi:hypothetical protein